MISMNVLLTFVTTSAVLGFTPGPDNIFVLTQAAIRGRKAGLTVTLGLCTGLIVHSLAVALGVAVVFQTSVMAFQILKYFGAGYLIFLAWKSFKASNEEIDGNIDNQLSCRKLYIRGIIMNITNPKVSIFFLAFLPQFADPAKGAMSMQIMLLGGLFILVTIIVFGSISFLAGILRDLFNKSNKAQEIMHKLAAIVFVGLAIKLITARQ